MDSHISPEFPDRFFFRSEAPRDAPERPKKRSSSALGRPRPPRECFRSPPGHILAPRAAFFRRFPPFFRIMKNDLLRSSLVGLSSGAAAFAERTGIRRAAATLWQRRHGVSNQGAPQGGSPV